MIFICVGSREYQFDRLLKKVDELIDLGIIEGDVFAQIGQSFYMPRNYKYERFLSVDDFKRFQKEASLIISHAGTGALIGALKEEKQVIAVPRLSVYKEHTDDHQIQVASVLEEQGYLRTVLEIDKLGEVYISMIQNPISKRYNRPSKVYEIITEFIENNK